MFVTDPIDIAGTFREDVVLSVAPALQLNADPSGGVYDALSTVDCYIEVSLDPSGVTVAAGARAGYKLLANQAVPVLVRKGMKIGAVAGGAGILSLQKTA